MPLGDPAGYLKPTNTTLDQYGPTSGVYNPKNAAYRGPITGTPAGNPLLTDQSQGVSPLVTNPPVPSPVLPALPVQLPQGQFQQRMANRVPPTPTPNPNARFQNRPDFFMQGRFAQLMAQLQAMFPNGMPMQAWTPSPAPAPAPPAAPPTPRGSQGLPTGLPSWLGRLPGLGLRR